jgi:hypothetical protein
MTMMTKSSLVLAACLALSGCGCGGSERSASSSSPDTGKVEIVGSARFQLPASWTGGENDGGGFEYTNGELALMVGRAPSGSSATLDAFFDQRVQVLKEQGRLEAEQRGSKTIAGKPARTLSAVVVAADGSALSIRMLAAEPNGSERLSLLMIGEKARAVPLEQAWDFVLGTLRFE